MKWVEEELGKRVGLEEEREVREQEKHLKGECKAEGVGDQRRGEEHETG